MMLLTAMPAVLRCPTCPICRAWIAPRAVACPSCHAERQPRRFMSPGTFTAYAALWLLCTAVLVVLGLPLLRRRLFGSERARGTGMDGETDTEQVIGA